MDSDDLADVPKGTLPVTQNMLRKRILEDPDKAWDMLRTNPVAVVALSKIRRDLENEEEIQENENYQKFMEQFENQLDHVFDVEPVTHEMGIALTVELLNEHWRRRVQSQNLSSTNDLIVKSLIYLYEKTDQLENTSSNTVIRGMVDFALKRILDFQDYEQTKAKEHWNVLKPDFKSLIDKQFAELPDEKISKEWQSWFYFATASNVGMEYIRNQIAKLIFPTLKDKFQQLPEEAKYQVAPWMHSFKNLLDQQENT